MDLEESVVTYNNKFIGNENFDLAAGDRLQLRKRVSGEITDFLDETVPGSKSWNVIISVKIEESDA